MKSPKLVVLYQQMSDLTRDKCGKQCYINPQRMPENRCCDKIYCESARLYAKEEYGVELRYTDHHSIPFMGPEGCIVAPHLRPLCTIHNCKINSLGTSGDQKWDEKYFDLHGEIDEEEFSN